MILAVDHLAVCCKNPVQAQEQYISNGYEIYIQENNLKNLQIKRPFLYQYSPVHDLLLMKKADSISIELLEHHSVNPHSGYLEQISGTDLTCNTADEEASLAFWKKCGFKEESQGVLVFNSFFSAVPIRLILKKADEKSPLPLLDDIGGNCIALLTSSVEQERENLKSIADVSPIETLTVGGRQLKIFFARNIRGGELTEMFEIIRS